MKTNFNKKILQSILLLLMVCSGQMAFASGWGGMSATMPGYGTHDYTKSDQPETVTSVESNQGWLGESKTNTKYTTSACGIKAEVTASGSCSGSNNKSGGCGSAEAKIGITIANNATQACIVNHYGSSDSSNKARRYHRIKIIQHIALPSAPNTKVGDAPYSMATAGKNIQGSPSGITPT